MDWLFWKNDNYVVFEGSEEKWLFLVFIICLFGFSVSFVIGGDMCCVLMMIIFFCISLCGR